MNCWLLIAALICVISLHDAKSLYKLVKVKYEVGKDNDGPVLGEESGVIKPGVKVYKLRLKEIAPKVKHIGYARLELSVNKLKHVPKLKYDDKKKVLDLRFPERVQAKIPYKVAVKGKDKKKRNNLPLQNDAEESNLKPDQEEKDNSEDEHKKRKPNPFSNKPEDSDHNENQEPEAEGDKEPVVDPKEEEENKPENEPVLEKEPQNDEEKEKPNDQVNNQRAAVHKRKAKAQKRKLIDNIFRLHSQLG